MTGSLFTAEAYSGILDEQVAYAKARGLPLPRRTATEVGRQALANAARREREDRALRHRDYQALEARTHGPKSKGKKTAPFQYIYDLGELLAVVIYATEKATTGARYFPNAQTRWWEEDGIRWAILSNAYLQSITGYGRSAIWIALALGRALGLIRRKPRLGWWYARDGSGARGRKANAYGIDQVALAAHFAKVRAYAGYARHRVKTDALVKALVAGILTPETFCDLCYAAPGAPSTIDGVPFGCSSEPAVLSSRPRLWTPWVPRGLRRPLQRPDRPIVGVVFHTYSGCPGG